MKSVSHIILAALLGSGAPAAIASQEIDFSQHDTNGDGQLTYDEWTDVEIAFEDVDQNNDHFVDRQEVREAGIALEQAAQEGGPVADREQDRDAPSRQASDAQRGKDSFRQADGNQDGRVSRDEADKAGYDYVVMFFDPIDADSDGYLDEAEWGLNETRSRDYDRAESADNVSAASFENEERQFNEPAAGSFDVIDADNDGAIDQEEARQDEYVAARFEEWDRDDDGLVEAADVDDEDFLGWGESAFEDYDVNDDGMLDEDEARDNDYVDANFNSWDNNEDGFLDENEAAETWYNDDDTFGSDY